MCLLIWLVPLFFFSFSVFGCHMACGILVPQPGTEPVFPAVEAWSPNHWTAREFPWLVPLSVTSSPSQPLFLPSVVVLILLGSPSPAGMSPPNPDALNTQMPSSLRWGSDISLWHSWVDNLLTLFETLHSRSPLCTGIYLALPHLSSTDQKRKRSGGRIKMAE